VRIDYGEAELRELLKSNGGYWNPDKKAWQLSFRKVVEPGLEKRLLDGEAAMLPQLALSPTGGVALTS